MEHRNLVTVVCTGNVCRSPMGAALLAHALAAEDEPLRQLTVVSAGVSAYAGDPASDHAVRALSKVGLDLGHHRSRRLSEELLERSVLVLAMTEQHRQIIRQAWPQVQVPVRLYREFVGRDPEDQQVPDPYGADLTSYVETRDALADAVPAIVRHLKELLATPRPPTHS